MNKILLMIINFLPLIFIIAGLIALTIGSYLINTILGVFITGVCLIAIGIMLIPIKLKG